MPTCLHRALGCALALLLAVSALVAVPAATAQAQEPEAQHTLVFTTQPAGASGGTPFATQPVVEVQDDAGATVATEVLVTLALVQPTSATLSCAPVTTVAGVATFSGCHVDQAGEGHVLRASADGLTAGDSLPFAVTVGPAAALVFTTSPSADQQVGGALVPSPSVEIRDAGGNALDESAAADFSIGALALNAAEAPEPLQDCTGGREVVDGGATFVSVPLEGTAATFRDCTIARAGSGYTLLAAAVPADPAQDALLATSDTFTVATGQATHLQFVQPPSGAVLGMPMLRPPVVAVKDAAGNTVASTTPVSLDLVDHAPGLALDCPAGQEVAAVDGIADFGDCAIVSVGVGDPPTDPGFRIVASASGLDPVASAPQAFLTGDAANLEFTTEPGDGTGGIALSSQPVVEVLDAAGTPVAGTVELALAEPDADAGFACSSPAAAAPRGVATFFGCAVDHPGTYALVATDLDSGTVATSAPFEVVVGDPVLAVVADAPTEGFAGTPFTVQVELHDAGGNVAERSGDEVRLDLAAGGGEADAELHCRDGETSTTTGGVATFVDCSVDDPGTYRLLAVTEGSVGVGDELTVALGPPATVTVLSAPAAAIDEGLLATTQVLVEDAGGNPVDVPVSLAVTGGAVTGCATTTTATRGTAAFPGCRLGAAGTAVTLVITAGDAGTSVDVPVLPGPPVGGAEADVPLAQTFGGDVWANNPTDVTNDVNAATGALTLTVRDLHVAGIGLPFDLTRSYSSADTTGGVFGQGWSSVLDAGVTVDGDTATVRGEDGQQVVFTKDPKCRGNGTCAWIAPPGSASELSCRRSTCTVERVDGTTLTSEDGRITSLTARTGHGLAFEHDRRGRSIAVSLTTSGDPLVVDVTLRQGRVTRVATPTRDVTYGHDGGLLTSVTDPSGRTTTYAHDAAGRIIHRVLGETDLIASYGEDGRVASVARTGSQRRHEDTYASVQDAATGITTTSRHSRVTAFGEATTATYLVHHVGNVVIGEQAPDGATLAYSLDANANLVAFQDALGNVQRFTHGPGGDLLTQVNADGGVVQFTWDDAHRPLTMTDPLGATTAYAYSGALLRWVIPPDPEDPEGQPGNPGTFGTWFEYDEYGQLVQERTSRALRTFTYDDAGNETGHQVFARDDEDRLHPLNGMGPRQRHDEAGNVVSLVDPRGHHVDGSVDPDFETTFTYDPAGRAIETRRPNGEVTTSTWTVAGELASTTRTDEGTTTYTWDETTRTRTAAGAVPGTWVFDAAGTVLSRSGAGGGTTTFTHDLLGRTVVETDPAGGSTRYAYDAMSQVVHQEDTTGDLAFAYAHGRIVRTEVDGAVVTTDWDQAGNRVAVHDASGGTTTYVHDPRGRLVSLTDQAGTTTYAYDLDDNLTRVTDGAGTTTELVNDAAGRVVSRTVDGVTWTATHDVAGNVIATTDPDGRTTTTILDAWSQPIETTHSQPGKPDIVIEQEFDAAGRRTRMTDPTGTTQFTHDGAGALASVVAPSGTFLYDRTIPGQVTTTYPDGTPVVTRYDDMQRVMGVSAPGVEVAYTRSADGLLTGIATGNGLFEAFGHDAEGRLVSQELRCGSDVLMTTRYGHDDLGRPLGTERVVAGATIIDANGYDDAHRLAAGSTTVDGTPAVPTAACIDPTTPPAVVASTPTPEVTSTPPPAPTTVRDPVAPPGLDDLVPSTEDPIAYDAVGNRTSSAEGPNVYGDGQQLLASGDGRTYTYDGAGNLTTVTRDGATTSYGYDAAGRLVEVGLPDGRTITYTLDGDGLRVARRVDDGTATTYAWDRSGPLPRLVLEQDDPGTTRRYVHGASAAAMQVDDETYYLHADRRANVTGVSDAAGALVATYAYDAFGNEVVPPEPVTAVARAIGTPAPPDPSLRFSGQLLDEDTGLYHMGTRQYDPSLGRFTQPSTQDAGDAPLLAAAGSPALALYVYAENNPEELAQITGGVETAGGWAWDEVEATSPLTWARHGVKAAKIGGPKIVTAIAFSKTALKFQAGSMRNFGTGLARAGKASAYAKTAAKGLVVVGVGLAIWNMVEACDGGSTTECVAASIDVSFTIACTTASGGTATVICAAAGFGLQQLTLAYGDDVLDTPVSVSGIVLAAAGATIGLLCTGLTVGVLAPACIVGGTVLSAWLYTFGDEIDAAIVSGFNDLADAVSSGFDAAMALLAQVDPEKVVAVLVEGFHQGVDEVVGFLEDTGAEVLALGGQLLAHFATTPELAVLAFGPLGYGATAVATLVEDAFADVAGWSAADLSLALSVAFPITAVGAALGSVLGVGPAEVAATLQTLNRTAAEIASVLDEQFGVDGAAWVAIADAIDLGVAAIAEGLREAYDAAAEVVVGLLYDIGATAEEIGPAVQAAFEDAIGWTDQALADALYAAGLDPAEIARSLQAALDASLTEVALALDELGVAAEVIADTLVATFAPLANELADVLVDALGVDPAELVEALESLYGLATDAIADVLGDLGIDTAELGEFFAGFAEDAAELFDPTNWI